MAATETDPEKVFSFDHDVLGELDKKPKQSLLDLRKNPLLVSILEGCATLKQMLDKDKIPLEFLSTAKGLLLMKTDKIGFGISITQGYGLVIARLPNTTYGWSAPLPVKVDGFSVGAVMGFTSHSTVICLANDTDISAFTQDKRAYKIGLDFGINLGDQVNESAAVNTQTGQKCDTTGVKTKVFTLSKGFLVDVSMQGTSVEPDKDDMKAAYGPDVTSSDILTGLVAAPRETKLLYKQLRVMLEKHLPSALTS